MRFNDYLRVDEFFGESLWDKFFRKIPPESEPELNVVDPYTKSKNKVGADREKIKSDASTRIGHYGMNSLYHALIFYNKLNQGTKGYSPSILVQIANSEPANKEWNEKYRKWFDPTKPRSSGMMLDKAFKEMGLPEPKTIENTAGRKPRQEVSLPDFKTLVDFIHRLISDETPPEEIQDRVKEEFPGLANLGRWQGARIGKAWKAAAKKGIKKYQPEPEEKPRQGIIKFPSRLKPAEEE